MINETEEIEIFLLFLHQIQMKWDPICSLCVYTFNALGMEKKWKKLDLQLIPRYLGGLLCEAVRNQMKIKKFVTANALTTIWVSNNKRNEKKRKN